MPSASFAQRIPEIPKGKGLPAWKDYAWLMWYAARSSPGQMALLGFLLLVTPFAAAGFFWLTKGLIDALAGGNTGRATWMLGGLLGTFILRAVVETGRTYVQEVARFSLDTRVKEDTMQHLRRLDPALLEHPKFQAFYHAYEEERGDLLSGVQTGYWFLYNLLETIGTVSVLLFLPWWIAVAVVGLLLLSIPLQRHERSWSWAVLSMESREGRRGIYYKDVLLGANWLTSRWVLGLHGMFFQRWRDLVHRVLAVRLKQTSLRARGQFFTQFVTFAGFALGGIFLFREVIRTGAIGTLVVFFPAYDRLAHNIANMFSNLAWIQTRLPGAQLVRSFWRLAPRREGRRSLPKKPLTVTFDAVSFAYPEQEKPVLQDLSLSFREGEYIALVGLNGAGKTTFLKLLAGIYQPTAGRILVNGIPLAEIRPDQWVAALGYMTQSLPAFDDTVREQIRYGDPDRPWSKRGDLALEVSGFGEIARALPRGLDTHVGRAYGMPEDDPVELSGGQRQLLMIAQTLYRRARVVIFDEPTSAVDAEKEEAFFAKLPPAVEGRLCFVVSHRFSVLRRAERILVMEEGRIIEDGSHDELVGKRGRYASLFALQAKMYQ